MLVNNHSLNSTTLALVLFIFIAGGLVSAGLSDSDLLNFLSNGAEADRTRAETKWQQELKEMERPYLEAEREAYSKKVIAQTESDTQLLTAEGERRRKVIAAQAEADSFLITENARLGVLRSEQEMKMHLGWSLLWTRLALIAGIVISMVCGYSGLRFVHLLLVHHPKKPNQDMAAMQGFNEPWKYESFRKEQRRKAMLVERQLRQARINATENFPILFPEITTLRSNEPVQMDFLRK